MVEKSLREEFWKQYNNPKLVHITAHVEEARIKKLINEFFGKYEAKNRKLTITCEVLSKCLKDREARIERHVWQRKWLAEYALPAPFTEHEVQKLIGKAVEAERTRKNGRDIKIRK